MEKKIIIGVLSVLLLFLLLAFVGARVSERDYMYGSYDDSSSYRNVVVYDSTDDYDAEDYYYKEVDTYNYYVDSDYDYEDDYDNNYMMYDSKKDKDKREKDYDYNYDKKDTGKCYEPLEQVRKKHCYRPIPQVRSNCDKNSPYGCYIQGYYGNYYDSKHMNYDDFDCY